MSAGGNLPLHPEKKVIDSATRKLIECLLLERISLAGIARAVLSEVWLRSLREREMRLCATKCTGDTEKKGRREQFKATSCSRSWITRGTNSGFGLRSMRTHVKSLAFTLGDATKPQPASCGNPCPRYIVNVQLLIPIFGQQRQ